MILLDTSGLLAALDPDEVRHDECAGALRAADGPYLLSPFVLAELDYLVRRNIGAQAEVELLAQVATGAYRLAQFDTADVGRAAGVVERFADLGVGLADASIVVLADKYGSRDVLTLDEPHFRALRTSAGEAFRLIPADHP